MPVNAHEIGNFLTFAGQYLTVVYLATVFLFTDAKTIWQKIFFHIIPFILIVLILIPVIRELK